MSAPLKLPARYKNADRPIRMFTGSPFFLSCLALLAGDLLAAASTESRAPWISPMAGKVIDRSRAAYAALDGWTATTVGRSQVFKNGVEQDPDAAVRQMTRTERFLNDGSAVGNYAFSSTLQDEHRPSVVSVQNAGEQFGLARNREGKLLGSVKLPATYPWGAAGPDALVALEAALRDATHVGYFGQELIDGKRCDVIQVLQSELSTGLPARIVLLNFVRFHVDPDGFILRYVSRQDSLEERPASPDRFDFIQDMRVVRFDAKAKLSAADFSREAFERDAQAILLAGESLPGLQQKEFRPGERLPDMKFIGWADQRPFRISDFQGKIVVVETWASWCHFCKEAFPYYEKMRQQLAAQDVVFVAVSFDEKAANYEKWMKANAGQYGFQFGLVDAPDARAAMKEFRGSLPAFYVLGRDGKIVGSYTGYGYGVGGEDPRLLDALRNSGVTP